MNENENSNGSVAKLEIPQYEMFPAIFAGNDGRGLNVKRNENGTSVTVLKRTGKTDSLAALSGKSGDSLKAFERTQRDWLKVRMNQVVSAAMASTEYTGGSMRFGKNGSLSFRLAKVDAVKAPAITSDAILDKFTSEELMELAEKRLALDAEKDALEVAQADAESLAGEQTADKQPDAAPVEQADAVEA